MRLNNIFIRLFIIMTLLFSFACISTNSEQPLYSSISLDYYELGASAFESEIAKKEKILLEKSVKKYSDKDRAILFLQLAILYSHRNNANSDLTTAKKYFKQYTLLQNQVSVEYTQIFLDDMIDNKLKYDQLIKAKKQLEKLNSGLVFKIRSKNKIIENQEIIIQENVKEIKKKNEIIEKLKVLDIQLENRRAGTE